MHDSVAWDEASPDVRPVVVISVAWCFAQAQQVAFIAGLQRETGQQLVGDLRARARRLALSLG